MTAPHGTDVPANFTREAAWGEHDELCEKAMALVRDERRASITQLQRRFQIGYNRAAYLIEALEKLGVVSAPDRSGSRKVIRS